MASARAEPGQQIKAGRDLAKTGEVMLDEKGAVKAERLRLDIVVDEVSKTLAAVGVGPAASDLRAAEQSKAHLILLGKSCFTRSGSRTRGDCSAGLRISYAPEPLSRTASLIVVAREVQSEEVLRETNIARGCTGDNDCDHGSDGRTLGAGYRDAASPGGAVRRT